MKTRIYRTFSLWAVVCCLSLVFAAQAKAQTDPTNIHVTCTGTTVCSSGSTTLVTTAANPTFNLSSPDKNGGTGELILVALVPNTTATFTVNGSSPTLAGTWSGTPSTLYGFLSVDSMMTANPNFSAYVSASGQAGVTAANFRVYTFDLGAFTSNVTTTSVTIGGPGVPIGTIFYAFLRSAQGTTLEAINGTPLSGALTTTVPEPGSMLLFGSGLLVLGGAVRRRWSNRV